MIKTDFPECCQNCSHLDVDATTVQRWCIGDKDPECDTEIYCRNRFICYKRRCMKDESFAT